MANWIAGLRDSSGVLVALGRSIFTEWVSSGAVTMKITSSTSMMSTNGMTLISAIGALRRPPPSKPPNAILSALHGGGALDRDRRGGVADLRAGDQEGEEVV